MNLKYFFFRCISIVRPYQVHRFDGAAMDQRWSSDGGTSEEKRRKSMVSNISSPRLFVPENKKNIKIEKKVEKSGGKWGKLCNFERKL